MRRLVLADYHSDGRQRASNPSHGLPDCDRNNYNHSGRNECDLHDDRNSDRDHWSEQRDMDNNGDSI